MDRKHNTLTPEFPATGNPAQRYAKYMIYKVFTKRKEEKVQKKAQTFGQFGKKQYLCTRFSPTALYFGQGDCTESARYLSSGGRAMD